MSLKQKTDAWLRIKKKKRNGVKSRKSGYAVIFSTSFIQGVKLKDSDKLLVILKV